ncbi:MAG: 3'-5' exonuclease [candidate division KSB1 bacterium]|nr:3'-5' exonuclease [candidate division KSB1 bacterium]
MNEHIRILEETGQYRVLRRVPHPAPFEVKENTRCVAYIDVETTGLDSERDQITQLSIVYIYYDGEGKVVGIREGYNSYTDPGIPIPEHITRLTGITNADVKGKVIQESDIEGILKDVNMIIAHNAQFDRPFLERKFKIFERFPWACSKVHIPWRDFAEFGSDKLEYILFKYGYFYDAHNAISDCLAAAFLLTQKLPDGRGAMETLLGNAWKNDLRIWAVDSPFDSKDILRQNGYRWNNGDDGRPKSWHKYIPSDELTAEAQWLVQNIYGASRTVYMQVFDPLIKFSLREPRLERLRIG